MTYGISVEQLPDSGAPQVGITVDGLDGAAVISVEVSWDGGESWHGVRGAQRVEVVGGAFFRDHVPPLNVEARYRLTVHQGTLLPRVRYAWDGTEGLSTSTEYVDGSPVRRNRVANPSFEVSAAGVSTSSAATAGRVVTARPSRVGGYLLGVDVAGASSSQYVLQDAAIPSGSVGKYVGFTPLVGRSTGSNYTRATIQFRDGVGATLSTVSGGIEPMSNSDLDRRPVAGVVPAGAVTARCFVYAFSTSAGGVATDGRTLTDAWVCDVFDSQAAALANTYFDGSFPSVSAPTEATITVTSDSAWLQDPLNPRAQVAIRTDTPRGSGHVLMYGSLASATWAQDVDLALPMGASRAVASIGQRMVAGQVPLRISYDVAAEGGALRRLLMSAGQLVVRGLPDGLLDPVAHIVANPASEQRVGGGSHQVAVWNLTATQVRPTALSIVVPWWTYDQVREMWDGASYDDVKAARPGDTYLDWQRTPEVP